MECYSSGHCSPGVELCTQSKKCSAKDTRCVKDFSGENFVCLPERPPLRCGQETCQSAGAPVCIMETGKAPRCGGYDEAPPDTLECFRDEDCEKGAVCCVGAAEKTMCLKECNFFSLGHTAICKGNDDCDRYFKKHRAERERSGITAMVCEVNPWRGIGSCTSKK